MLRAIPFVSCYVSRGQFWAVFWSQKAVLSSFEHPQSSFSKCHMYVCMYVCMWSMLRYVCIYVSMYICIYVSMYVVFFVFLNQSHQPCVPSMCISSDYVCTSWATCPFLWWLQHQFALSLAKLFYPLLSVSRSLLFAWRLPSNVLWLHSISLFARLLFFWWLLQHFESSFAILFPPFINVILNLRLHGSLDGYWHFRDWDVDFAHKFTCHQCSYSLIDWTSCSFPGLLLMTKTARDSWGQIRLHVSMWYVGMHACMHACRYVLK